ncbi:hypothetical protein [Thermus filiformis]|uniref:hypothetical protein n=1 Tax=Thermus filiformis TaxID=276 RepID=UPI0005315513|nr:hypothetical protein [Thermus filiformis]
MVDPVARALLGLLLLLLASFLLTRKPLEAPSRPQGVRLYGVELALYPQEKGVEWRFQAEELRQEGREVRVYRLREAGRYVGGRLDARLYAPEVQVDAQDDLRAPRARVEILKGCYVLELEGPVLIRQKEGIYAPRVRIQAPNLRGEAREFHSDFALERMEALDPRFEFPTGGRFGPCQVKGGSS